MLREHPDLGAEMGAAGAKAAQRFSVAPLCYEEFVRITYDFLDFGPEPEPPGGPPMTQPAPATVCVVVPVWGAEAHTGPVCAEHPDPAADRHAGLRTGG